MPHPPDQADPESKRKGGRHSISTKKSKKVLLYLEGGEEKLLEPPADRRRTIARLWQKKDLPLLRSKTKPGKRR